MRFLITLGLICFLSVASVVAQESNPNVVFGGFRYDQGIIVSGGYATNVNDGLWSFNYIDFGNAQVANIELGYLWDMSFIAKKLYLGVIAGPNTDWVGAAENDDASAITYLLGAAGGVACYNISDSWGLWGYTKYRFALEENAYKNMYLGGGGLFYRF